MILKTRKKSLERVLAFGMALCLLPGCSLLKKQTPQPETKPPPQRIVTGTSPSKRGADLEPVNGVGELVEPEENKPGSSEAEQPENVESPLRWDLSLLPYREMLMPEEQKVYDEIYSNIMALRNHFSLRNPARADRIDSIVHAVYYDNPELLWIDSSYRYGYTSQGQVTDLTVAFNNLAASREEAVAEFEKEAQAIIQQAQQFPTPVEQEKFVHDAIIAVTDYHLSSAQNQSAYSALVGKQSVCAGYSRAFQYIMMELGIPCYYCVGYAGEDHAWNIIKLGDGFYNVDLAWDDPIGSEAGEIHYEYFNITDEKIGYDHQRQDLSIHLPPCTAQEESYNRIFGQDSPVREGGAPADYRSLGYTEEDVVHTLAEYYERSQQAVEALGGPGKSTAVLVLEGAALRQQVLAALSNRDWFNGFVTPAARNMGLKNYSAGISAQYEELADGYLLLTQEIDLQAG